MKAYIRNCEQRILRNRTTASHDHKLALAAIGLKNKSTNVLRKRLQKEIEDEWCTREAKQISELLKSVCLDKEEEEEEEEEEKEEEKRRKVISDSEDQDNTYVTYRPLIPSVGNARRGQNSRLYNPNGTLPYAPYYTRLVKRVAGVLNCSNQNLLREIQRIEARFVES